VGLSTTVFMEAADYRTQGLDLRSISKRVSNQQRN
jgi:hypothetical protein